MNYATKKFNKNHYDASERSLLPITAQMKLYYRTLLSLPFNVYSNIDHNMEHYPANLG